MKVLLPMMEERPLEGPVKHIAVVCVCLCAISVFAGCRDDLETVIAGSRICPSLYGDTIYYQGMRIGSLETIGWTKMEAYAQLLKNKGQWVDKSVTRPGFTTYSYDPKTKQTTAQYHSPVTISTSVAGREVFDINGKLKLVLLRMTVPESDGEGFVYFSEEDRLEKSEGVKKFAPDESWKEEVVLNSSYFPWDAAAVRSDGKKDELYDAADFAERAERTLKAESETIGNLGHISTGFNCYYVHFYNDSSLYNLSYTKLDLSVSPFLVCYLQGDLSWRYFFLKGEIEGTPANAGGSLKTGGSAAHSFGMNDTAMFFVNAAAGLMGCELKLTVEQYDLGKAEYYASPDKWQPDNKTYLESYDVSIKKKQLDLIYHPVWRDIPRLGGTGRKTKVWDIYGGYRYAETTSLQVVYNRKSAHTDELASESRPQNFTLSSHLVGAGINNFLKASEPGLNFLFGAECYAGISRGKADARPYTQQYPDVSGSDRVLGYTFVPGVSGGVLVRINGSDSVSSIKVLGSWCLYYTNYNFPGASKSCPAANNIQFSNVSISYDMVF